MKTHPVFDAFFKFDGPSNTAFELNGWGDDQRTSTLKGHRGRRAASACLYSNKDYGWVWIYDWRNKRFAEDNTKSAVNLQDHALTA